MFKTLWNTLFGKQKKPTTLNIPSPPRGSTSGISAPQSTPGAAIHSQQSWSSSPPSAIVGAEEKMLKAFAENLKRNGTSFVKLNEMGVSEADRDPKRSAVCFLVALDLKPGDKLALSNLDWVAGRGKGVNVDEIRAVCGFTTTSALAPTSFSIPTLESPPTIT